MDLVEQSKQQTLQHKADVKAILQKMIRMIDERGETHDNSKLCSPEVEVFAEHTHKLGKLHYDSPEYKEQLEEMQLALKHHYARNRHHPEHYSNKLSGFNLIDLIELFADWKSSSQRQLDGNLLISIDKNQERFGYSDDLASILRNTAELMDL